VEQTARDAPAMTPHIEAGAGDYAEVVLVPGDPLRARWIAETFLTDARCVNTVRGAYGYTGFHGGRRVSVQATGMGRPSFSIYVHELVTVYGVRTVIRVGSCGALTLGTPLRDIFVARSAVMDTDIGDPAVVFRPDARLLEMALDGATGLGVPCHSGAMVSSDIFYHPTPETRFDAPRAAGIVMVDMETANLFAMSARLGFRALSICTIVDNLMTGEETALSERHEIFRGMSRVALDVVARLPQADGALSPAPSR
jgi:purine-nucleoside phosphorylase